MTRLLCAVIALCLCALVSAQQPRDNRPRPGSGTSTVHGVVFTDTAPRTPLRRAKVTINGVEIEFARTVITGDDGAFVFDGLPAGRYVLTASKDGYVTSSAGARRLGRLGDIELPAGGTARVDLAMIKGGVITGRVQLPNNEPAAGISVQVLRFDNSGPLGDRRLAPAGIPAVTTDDRGEYRIFGLAAGTYYVRAQSRFQMVPGADEGFHVPTEAEIRAALAEVKAEATSSRPGVPPKPRPAPAAPAPRRGITLAPTYFPGTSIPDRAAAVALKPGEIRAGVDIDLEYVPLAMLEGFVNLPPGTGRAVLTLSSAEVLSTGFRRGAGASQEGAFSFRGVPPGTYVITVRALPADPRGGSAVSSYWGRTDVTVSGEDLSGITITTQPGLTLSGRVVFDATSGVPSQIGAIHVPPLQATNVTFATNASLPPIRFDGQSFVIDGIVPGIYRFLTPPRGIRTPIGRWWLKSFVLNGADLLDQELEIKENSDTAVVTFSDRASELSGTVQYLSGLAVRDEMVIAFSTDPRHWFYGSRRIAAVRPSEAGRYVVRNFPPGDYFVAATGELAQGEWYAATALKALSREATVVRVGADARVVHDLRLNR